MTQTIETSSQPLSSGKLVTVLFNSPYDAERAYVELLNQGYDHKDISVLMSQETRESYFSNEDVQELELETKALEGLGIGGATGATLGAIAAALAALGTTLFIPALGIVVAGSLAASFAGAGIGAAAGGIVEALIGASIPDEKAREYEKGIQAGGVVLGLMAESDEDAQTIETKLKSLQD
ncbi:MAG: hypothetical protein K2P93_09300 [Alphaproteobacteria bacterium]|nr:hypothetical protein [Alphaproteobacteria bacterium]